jgi:hypothetical protein
MTIRRSAPHAKGRWSALLVVATIMLLVGAQAVLANLSGSSFDAGDGNLVLNDEAKDWANAPNLQKGIDKPTGATDDSFGQGTKEDTEVPTIVDGSIPPNKSDLTRFYVANEKVSNKDFLYLAWERVQEPNGTTNMDFEFNQRQCTPGLTPADADCSANGVTPIRSAGDILIKYDLSQGGTNPTLGYHKWVTSGSSSQCEANNSVPCWGTAQALTGFFEGSINDPTNNPTTGVVVDPIAPDAPRNLSARTFGEAAINLTDSQILPQGGGTCAGFGSAYLKSRSSDAFTAAVKDFVAPIPVNINNCGTIKITKVAQNGDATFSYSSTGGLPSPAAADGTFSLTTLSGTDTKTFNSVLGGVQYTVTESGPPSGWTFVSLACTDSGGASSLTAGQVATINMVAGGEVDCTFTNHTKLSPTIATTLSANPVSIGTAMHDSATLTGATAGAGGTVTYSAYAGANTCSGTDLLNSTVTVTNGSVPDSANFTPANAGTYSFQAVYSGDADNNSATSLCSSEQLVVNKNQPDMSTAQKLLPNDKATLSGATATAGGTIHFYLFGPGNATCDLVNGGTSVFDESVNVSGNATYNTSNTTIFAETVGTWRWLVVYSGDANNEGKTSACGVENFTITNS